MMEQADAHHPEGLLKRTENVGECAAFEPFTFYKDSTHDLGLKFVEGKKIVRLCFCQGWCFATTP